MPFAVEQLPVLLVWSMALGATALLVGLLAVLLTTRVRGNGGGPLLRFMASNAAWSAAIALVMVPMAPLPRALVFHTIWIGAALTTSLWIRAVLTFLEQEDRWLTAISGLCMGLAVLIGLDAVATAFGAGWITTLTPMDQPGLMVRAAGNQVSFGPAAAVIGGVWALAALAASGLLARQVRTHAPTERLLLIGVVTTGVISVVDGVSATWPNTIALSFAANLLDAVVLTGAQVRRVASKLAAVERASQQQQEQVQEQLVQLRDLQRLSLIGARTARLSHDLRNPLTVVLAGVHQLQTLLQDAGHTSKDADEVARITELALERTLDLAAGMTRSARHAERPEPFAVRPCVEDALLLSSRQLEGIEVTTEVDDVTVVGQSGELTQVLVNLLQNAAEAVEGVESPWVRLSARAEGEAVSIQVQDAGPRPADAVVDRMFRAPFTTKGSSGTGLGLSICHHVVHGMGGSIRVERGSPTTAISIQLPRAKSQNSMTIPTRDDPVPASSR